MSKYYKSLCDLSKLQFGDHIAFEVSASLSGLQPQFLDLSTITIPTKPQNSEIFIFEAFSERLPQVIFSLI